MAPFALQAENSFACAMERVATMPPPSRKVDFLTRAVRPPFRPEASVACRCITPLQSQPAGSPQQLRGTITARGVESVAEYGRCTLGPLVQVGKLGSGGALSPLGSPSPQSALLRAACRASAPELEDLDVYPRGFSRDGFVVVPLDGLFRGAPVRRGSAPGDHWRAQLPSLDEKNTIHTILSGCCPANREMAVLNSSAHFFHF